MKKLFFFAVCALLLSVAMPAGALQYYVPAIPEEYVDQMSMDGDLTDWFAWIDPAFVYTYSENGWDRWGFPADDLEDFDYSWMWAWSPKTNLYYFSVGIHDDEHIEPLFSFEDKNVWKDDCWSDMIVFGRYTGICKPDGSYDGTNLVRFVGPGSDFTKLGEGRFNCVQICMKAGDSRLGFFYSGHYPDAWYFQEPYCYWNASVLGNDCNYELAMALFDPWDLAGPDLSVRAILSEGYMKSHPFFIDADSGLNELGEDGMATGNCFQTGVFCKGMDVQPCIYLLAPEDAAVSSSSWGAIKALFR